MCIRDRYLATALVEVEKEADAFGEEFANRHKDDKIHYFVGAGNQYGATYSYAMCYWEEQHWIRTKSIHSAEFFHGMLEIIDKDTPVTVFIGEDSQRSLSERVANFLPRICGKYNIIDTKKFELKGISPEYRGYISHLVMHAVTQRIDVHMEKVNCHPTVSYTHLDVYKRQEQGSRASVRTSSTVAETAGRRGSKGKR